MSSQSNSDDKKSARAPKNAQTYESEGEDSAEEVAPPPRRKNRRQQNQQLQQQQQGGGGPLGNIGLDGVQNTAGGLVGGVTGALGGVAGNAVQQQGGGDKKSDTLRLRLDLNLEIEITLKAKIHGDLTLALLDT